MRCSLPGNGLNLQGRTAPGHAREKHAGKRDAGPVRSPSRSANFGPTDHASSCHQGILPLGQLRQESLLREKHSCPQIDLLEAPYRHGGLQDGPALWALRDHTTCSSPETSRPQCRSHGPFCALHIWAKKRAPRTLPNINKNPSKSNSAPGELARAHSTS